MSERSINVPFEVVEPPEMSVSDGLTAAAAGFGVGIAVAGITWSYTEAPAQQADNDISDLKFQLSYDTPQIAVRDRKTLQSEISHRPHHNSKLVNEGLISAPFIGAVAAIAVAWKFRRFAHNRNINRIAANAISALETEMIVNGLPES